jgi:hypothetical protein
VSLYYLYNLHLRKKFPGHAKVSCHGFTRLLLRLCNTLQATETALPCYITKHTDVRSTPLATLEHSYHIPPDLRDANSNDDDRECTGRCCLQVLRCVSKLSCQCRLSVLSNLELPVCYSILRHWSFPIYFDFRTVRLVLYWQCATTRSLQPLGNRSIRVGCPRRCGARVTL